jgi:hypothetical protein
MSKVTTIKSGKTLAELVKAVTEEAVASAKKRRLGEGPKSDLYHNAIAEKERQKKLMGEEEDDDLFGTGGDTGEDAKAAPEKGKSEEKPADSEDKSSSSTQKPSATVAQELEKLEKGDVTPKDVVDRLNAIRSGRSFKDSSIQAPLEEYVNSLTKAERVALLAFLKGISQIVTGEIPADQAVTPDSKEPDVSMKKGGDTKKVDVKPVIVKNPAAGVKRPSGEDTAGPAPIVPKKK